MTFVMAVGLAGCGGWVDGRVACSAPIQADPGRSPRKCADTGVHCVPGMERTGSPIAHAGKQAWQVDAATLRNPIARHRVDKERASAARHRSSVAANTRNPCAACDPRRIPAHGQRSQAMIFRVHALRDERRFMQVAHGSFCSFFP
ncbi:hypothetical protein [Lysobacter sp. Hz 25]|uniref:hypothetical protein n=1 Tax=Lysobacter sp. Hz 25 TaxID=3383698 RepID=UPI0038D3BD7E